MRDCVKILLLNGDDLLLMGVEDPTTTTLDGVSAGRAWIAIGGKIEEGESLKDAAHREIYEETGLRDVKLGPLVWWGEFEYMLQGKQVRQRETYLVGWTDERKVALTAPTEDEARLAKGLRWFSLEEISGSEEMVFPVVLGEMLPDVLAGKFPKEPAQVDLTWKPTV